MGDRNRNSVQVFIRHVGNQVKYGLWRAFDLCREPRMRGGQGAQYGTIVRGEIIKDPQGCNRQNKIALCTTKLIPRAAGRNEIRNKLTRKARMASGQRKLNDTVNGSLRLLRRMLMIAHEDGKIQIIPKIRLLKSSPARKGFLPKEQFDSLLSHLPVNLKPLVTLLYYCGVRKGEPEQIMWSQVDLDAALIRLEEDQTKNSEARTVPLPDVLVDMLRQIKNKEGLAFDMTNLRKKMVQGLRCRRSRQVHLD
jgi:integrase